MDVASELASNIVDGDIGGYPRPITPGKDPPNGKQLWKMKKKEAKKRRLDHKKKSRAEARENTH